MNDDQELSRAGDIIRKRKPSIKMQKMIDNLECPEYIRNLAKGIDWKELIKWIKKT